MNRRDLLRKAAGATGAAALAPLVPLQPETEGEFSHPLMEYPPRHIPNDPPPAPFAPSLTLTGWAPIGGPVIPINPPVEVKMLPGETPAAAMSRMMRLEDGQPTQEFA